MRYYKSLYMKDRSKCIMTKKSTKDFFKRYALSQEFKTKTVPNNSYREDGVQDRFVELLLLDHNNFISGFLHDYLDKLNDEQWLDFYKDYNRSFNH